MKTQTIANDQLLADMHNAADDSQKWSTFMDYAAGRFNLLRFHLDSIRTTKNQVLFINSGVNGRGFHYAVRRAKPEIDKRAINSVHCKEWEKCNHRKCMVHNDCSLSFFYGPTDLSRKGGK